MTPLIITILTINLIFFAIDINEDWRENRYQKKRVIALLLAIYVLIGFLSPVYRVFLYVKESRK
jgi:hypothetical protein